MGPASDCVVYLNRWLEQQQLLVTRRVPLNRALEGLRRASLRWLPRELQASLFRRLRDSLVPRLESRLRLHHVDRAASAAFSATAAAQVCRSATSRAAVVAQAGHSVMTDNPDGFRDAVTAFVLAE